MTRSGPARRSHLHAHSSSTHLVLVWTASTSVGNEDDETVVDEVGVNGIIGLAVVEWVKTKELDDACVVLIGAMLPPPDAITCTVLVCVTIDINSSKDVLVGVCSSKVLQSLQDSIGLVRN